MTKLRLIVTAFVGLAAAIVEAVLFPSTVATNSATNGLSIVVLVLSFVVAICAGLAILGQRQAHRYFTIAIPVLSAISAIAFNIAASTGYINLRITAKGLPDEGHTTSFIIGAVVGFVVYLIAATIYGFAGQRQGVKVGARTGLLVLLLLAVIPGVNILGLAGFVVTAFTRKGTSAVATTEATPARPAASA